MFNRVIVAILFLLFSPINFADTYRTEIRVEADHADFLGFDENKYILEAKVYRDEIKFESNFPVYLRSFTHFSSSVVNGYGVKDINDDDNSFDRDRFEKYLGFTQFVGMSGIFLKGRVFDNRQETTRSKALLKKEEGDAFVISVGRNFIRQGQIEFLMKKENINATFIAIEQGSFFFRKRIETISYSVKGTQIFESPWYGHWFSFSGDFSRLNREDSNTLSKEREERIDFTARYHYFLNTISFNHIHSTSDKVNSSGDFKAYGLSWAYDFNALTSAEVSWFRKLYDVDTVGEETKISLGVNFRF